MFEIEDINILITRGDNPSISLKLKNDNTFSMGDIVELKVYGIYELNNVPILYKKTTVLDIGISEALIDLSSEDPELSGKEYWYEIIFNDQPLVCFLDTII